MREPKHKDRRYLEIAGKWLSYEPEFSLAIEEYMVHSKYGFGEWKRIWTYENRNLVERTLSAMESA